MKIDNQILDYFAKSAMHPRHKVDRIDDEQVQKLVNTLLDDLPIEAYNTIKNSRKWKRIYGEHFDDRKAKELWLKSYLPNLIDIERIKHLVSQVDFERPRPYNDNALIKYTIDKHRLIDLSIFDQSLSASIGQGFTIDRMKFTLCQSIGGTNSSYWIANGLKHLLRDGHSVYGRLDPLIFNDIENFDDIEYRMLVWGKELDWQRFQDLRNEDHGQWVPDELSSQSIYRTDYIWNPLGNELHLTIEELPKEECLSLRGSRYLHAIFDKTNQIFKHCDGAIRIYDNGEYLARIAFHLKAPEVRKIGKRVKIFDIRSDLSIGEFISVCANYFIWNEDILHYFQLT